MARRPKAAKGRKVCKGHLVGSVSLKSQGLKVTFTVEGFGSRYIITAFTSDMNWFVDVLRLFHEWCFKVTRVLYLMLCGIYLIAFLNRRSLSGFFEFSEWYSKILA